MGDLVLDVLSGVFWLVLIVAGLREVTHRLRLRAIRAAAPTVTEVAPTLLPATVPLPFGAPVDIQCQQCRATFTLLAEDDGTVVGEHDCAQVGGRP